MILLLMLIGAISFLIAFFASIGGSKEGTYSFAAIAIACIAGLVVLQ